ncbi:hypothetical protein GJAV_G00143740 [Gymnothorax javanicus]|nr:hypothetical protein GJAV_G00143740 [Gymnothorax javanicus]
MWLRFSPGTGELFHLDLNTRQYVIGVTVFILLGLAMLIISAFAEYGACKENNKALRVYYYTIGLLAFAVIVAGILIYFYSDEVGEETVTFYNTVYTKYLNNRDAALSVTLKLFHNTMECCGMGGVLEPFVRDTCPSTKGILKALTLPPCPKVIGKFFTSRAPVVLGVFIGTGVLMLVTMVCCKILMKHIRKYEATPSYYK